jgi:hypothetical protein
MFKFRTFKYKDTLTKFMEFLDSDDRLKRIPYTGKFLSHKDLVDVYSTYNKLSFFEKRFLLKQYTKTQSRVQEINRLFNILHYKTNNRI